MFPYGFARLQLGACCRRGEQQADVAFCVCDVSTVQTHYGRGRLPHKDRRDRLTKHHSLLTHGAEHLAPPVSFYLKGFASQLTSSSAFDLKTPLILAGLCVRILNYTHEKYFGLLSRGTWEDSRAFYSKNKLGVLLIAAAKCLSTSFICLSQWAVVGCGLLEKPLFLPENWK